MFVKKHISQTMIEIDNNLFLEIYSMVARICEEMFCIIFLRTGILDVDILRVFRNREEKNGNSRAGCVH